MKKKKFSWMPRNSLLRGLMQSPLGILAINWVFQGMRGMQRKELSFRLLLEFLLFLLLAYTISKWVPLTMALIVGLIGAHTFNWLFNTHLWVCVRYFPIYRRNPDALRRFLKHQEERLRNLKWLEEAVCIGSVGDSGGIRSERSDIDLRLVFPSGFTGWIRTNILLLQLRVTALFQVIPLDLYAYDDVAALDRFRQDEGLRIISDRRGRVASRYQNRIFGNSL